MTKPFLCGAVSFTLAVALAGCSQKPSETDVKLAELEKQLAETRQELAAKTAEAGAAATGAAQTAAEAQAAATAAAQQAASTADAQAGTRAAATQSAAQASRDRAATEQALASQSKTLDAQTKALADQQAAAARQAEENERLQRELEAMKPREFTLPSGMAIPVRTTALLTTKSVKEGSVFEALLEKDLVVEGTTLAKAGSRVTCLVVRSDPGGRVKGVASLVVSARSIAGVNGNTLTVRTDNYEVDAENTKKRDTVRTGIATGAGALIGAIAGGGKGAAIGAGAGAAAGVGTTMATRGDPAEIPAETLISFRLTSPSTVVFRR